MPKTDPAAPDSTAPTAAKGTAAASAQESSGRRVGDLFRAVPGPLIGLIIIFVVMSILSPYFLTPRNLLNIITQVSDIGIMAVGQALVILIAGIDLNRVAVCKLPFQ